MKKKNLSRKNILTVIISVSVAAVLLVGLLVWNELAGRIDVSLDLVGAQKLVENTLKLKVTMSENPLESSIIGLSKATEQRQSLDKLGII